MGSTFAGLNTSFMGLTAARTAVDVAGQNVANANTTGYTRQRVSQSSVASVGKAGILEQPLPTAGGGVTVDAINRLGDKFLDARVRTALSNSGFHATRATAFSNIEKVLNEPSKDGLAAQLSKFWNSWQDLSNNAGKAAGASVVVEQAHVLGAQLADGYRAIDDQWGSTRGTVDAVTAELNNAGRQIAELNDQIRKQAAAGGSTNELVDRRNLLAEHVAETAGGVVVGRSDGGIDVLVGGNPLVSGADFNEVKAVGGTTLGSDVHLEWVKHPGLAIAMDGGELAAHLSLLKPANATGTGGALAESAEAYNRVATTLAATVNDVHRTGSTFEGVTGLDFFGFTPGAPAALGLNVIATGINDIAVGAAGAGNLDGSIADKISQLGVGNLSADGQWNAFVGSIAVTSQGELRQSDLADLSYGNASGAQKAQAGVDLDEESMNLISAQTAYQAAARAMTAMDELLDTLINKTGLVGR
ncbi:flagellar hook-associated protein FlgK [Leifsonia sp. Leaf264]|uniref:flagellar hook-associated protein FlgK n=1 Tax=Leifsonia sp. Leaf264 TaxID=1736314 RepID=UPI0006F416C8|nr:flagellar hook-associated protein FlgK [Leifsonia sp. Leaf264]KQO98255.1 flagellar biosynthesis protein FlgK [Leifsonia sp. Leaf264]